MQTEDHFQLTDLARQYLATTPRAGFKIRRPSTSRPAKRPRRKVSRP